MKILAPLKGFEQIDALISANPDEIYPIPSDVPQSTWDNFFLLHHNVESHHLRLTDICQSASLSTTPKNHR